jgi:gamma-glutamylcyclotransferase (GGCT)/AIG2-like uncharacterized protein YtfP
METDCKYLFIYGTLLHANNEFAIYLRKHSQPFAPGSFPGLLYDMGSYPGAVHNPSAAGKVFGNIVLLDENPEVLKVIDKYEGIGPDEPQPYLYLRELVPIQTTNEVMVCWVYLYNRPLDGFEQIVSGRYK